MAQRTPENRQLTRNWAWIWVFGFFLSVSCDTRRLEERLIAQPDDTAPASKPEAAKKAELTPAPTPRAASGTEDRETKGPGLEASWRLGRGRLSKDSVPVRFSLRNTSDEELWVSIGNTPLAEIHREMLQVTHRGAPLRFLGRQPNESLGKNEDSRLLAPGASLVRQVNLAPFYDFGRRGEYTLTLRLQALSVIPSDTTSVGAKARQIGLFLEPLRLVATP